jgi:hypothetical protein
VIHSEALVTTILRFVTARGRFKPLYICVTKRGAGSDNARVCVRVNVGVCVQHTVENETVCLKAKALIS